MLGMKFPPRALHQSILPFFFAGSSLSSYMLLALFSFFFFLVELNESRAAKDNHSADAVWRIMTVIVNNSCETVELGLTVSLVIWMLAQDKKSKIFQQQACESLNEQVVDVMAKTFLKYSTGMKLKTLNFIIQYTYYLSAVSMGIIQWQLLIAHDRYTSYLPTYPWTFPSNAVSTKIPLTMGHEHALKRIPISSVTLPKACS